MIPDEAMKLNVYQWEESFVTKEDHGNWSGGQLSIIELYAFLLMQHASCSEKSHRMTYSAFHCLIII
jgi:hypothetical protein